MTRQLWYSDWLRRNFERNRGENLTSLLLERIRRKPPLTVDNTYNRRLSSFVTGLCIKDLEWVEINPESADDTACDLTLAFDQIEGMHDYPFPQEGIINRFPGMRWVLTKANMATALCSMQSLTGDTSATFQKSWILPNDLENFSKHFYQQREPSYKKADTAYIVKPTGSSCGTGIYLIQDPSEYKLDTERIDVVQEYIDPPLLLEGLKFDLRVYVVLLSLSPLEIYISREGMARFCTNLYQHPTKDNMQDLYMHLANSSLQKTSDQYVDNDDENSGSKRTMSHVMKLLKERGLDVDQIWNEIKAQVGIALLAITPELKINHKSQFPPEEKHPCCFQILGFDFLLLEDGQPKFLEVNASPSLRVYRGRTETSPGEYEYTDNMVDLMIKKALVLDTLILVASRKHDFQRKAMNPPDTMAEEESKDSLAVDTGDFECLEKIDLATVSDQVKKSIGFVDKLANLFSHCQEEPHMPHLGPAGFSAFLRKCNIPNRRSEERPDLDVLKLDGKELSKGVSFQRAVEMILKYAKAKFPKESLSNACEELLNCTPLPGI